MASEEIMSFQLPISLKTRLVFIVLCSFFTGSVNCCFAAPPPLEKWVNAECKYVVRYPSEGIYNVIYHIYAGETFDWETGEFFVEDYYNPIPPPNTIYWHRYASKY